MGQAKEKEKPEKRKKGIVRKFLEAGFLMLASAYLAFSVNEARQWRKHYDFLENKEGYRQEYMLASLHNHTSHRGDGDKCVYEFLLEAHRQGYGIVAVTDHEDRTLDYCAGVSISRLEELALAGSGFFGCPDSGGFEVAKVNETTYKVTREGDEHALYVLAGAEITALYYGRPVHVLGIGLSKVPESHQSLEKTLIELKSQGALIGAPHATSRIFKSIRAKGVKEFQDFFDFVEINGMYAFPQRAILNFTAKRLGKRLGIPMVAAPDSHIRGQYFNRTLVMVEKCDSFDEKDIVGFLRRQFDAGNYRNIVSIPESGVIYHWHLFK